MEDIFRHFATHQVWQKHPAANSNTSPVMEPLEVTEMWCSGQSDENGDIPGHALRQRAVQPSLLRDWLEEPSSYSASDHHDEKAPPEQHRVLRIAWGEPECDSSSNKSLEVVLEAWKLRDAVNYARSCCAGVAALSPPPTLLQPPHHPPESEARIFAMSYHPKLALAWSHDGSGETRCVALAAPSQRAGLNDVLSSRWHAALRRHAMLPAFAACVMFGHELDATLESIKVEVREVEARTGYHRFSRRSTHPASDGELGDLSARMSGCATKLASGSRKIKMMEVLNEFMATHAGSGDARHERDAACRPTLTAPDQLPSASFGAAILRNNVGLLNHRSAMQAIDTAFVQQRVQTQVAALFHLIAQADNRLAFATARASRSIAESTLRDSASMKMLALVAMFFLPASFVAALFSTPLFDWDAAAAAGGGSGVGVATRPQFGLFWAIALPLTAGTFLIYAVWMLWQRRERRRNKEENERLEA